MIGGSSEKQVVVRRGTVSGQVVVIDGRTLWFANHRMLVRLREIDSCDLPQWAFDPRAAQARNSSLVPVPCGALAKAWLKRTVGSRVVSCSLAVRDVSDVASGVCKASGRDIAHEMLRVGWARLIAPVSRNGGYLDAQHHAVAARYGMWATYVLDMAEWRQKAIDKTAGRRPLADLNLLSERSSEISPPFTDARRQPSRRDR
ncbi:thermonuclease family protein [Pararhizobium sp. A13]|uniref:thermonuclease family protein n=1 Tax=Pararhizobium sp. A13 TaxID=3133975 RepID=UPI0032503C85